MSRFPKRVTIQLEEEHAELIQQAADKLRLSVSAFLRMKIIEALDAARNGACQGDTSPPR